MQTFRTLQNSLLDEPVLQYSDLPAHSQSLSMLIIMLSQGPFGKDNPIAYVSRTLNSVETR